MLTVSLANQIKPLIERRSGDFPFEFDELGLGSETT